MNKILFSLLFIFAFCIAAFGQNTPLRILEQPRPELPTNYRVLDAQGTQTVKVEFLETGYIGEVSPLNNLPGNLTERAVNAARKITFEPEVKDGKPVTVIKEIKYFYSWNGGWRIPDDPSSEKNTPADPQTEKAEAIIKKAVQNLGGDRYLQVKTQIGRGKFSAIRDGVVASFQSFVDVIVFPDKERTDFKGGGIRSVQTNTGDTGWTYDGENDMIKVQNEGQVQDFKRGLRVSLDNLLRGTWRNTAKLYYIGKRPAALGRRNDVVSLIYKDGYRVEFEFTADEGLPAKAIYTRSNANGEEIKEEDRYAQFIEVDGIKSPFIIDRFSNGTSSSRINYETIEFNKPIPDSIFSKPSSPKDAKKDTKL
jgi:Gram-negative bacterial TonB protein C-terminal